MWSRQASYTLWHVLCTLLHLIMRHCWLIMSCSNSPYTIRGATLPLISILGRYTKKIGDFPCQEERRIWSTSPNPLHTQKNYRFFLNQDLSFPFEINLLYRLWGLTCIFHQPFFFYVSVIKHSNVVSLSEVWLYTNHHTNRTT